MVKSAQIRFKVVPRDVPADKAARRLHLTLAEFERKLPELFERGFPRPDPTTGMYDLDAIDRWMTERHRHLDQGTGKDARLVVKERLNQRPRNGTR